MHFRIRGLPAAPFADLFDLPDSELETRLARRVMATDGGYPCRISLTDACPGETVILVNYTHHPVETPYRADFAIYVRPGERQYDAVDTVPDQLRRRLLSLRAYDERGMMIAAEVVDGREIEGGISRLFADGTGAYIHAHFAAPGCYAARIDRA